MNEIRVSSLTFKQLRAFVAVYQLRNLSAAAAQLCVTQSAVSVSIRQMELGLGVRLFDRTTRSLVPTAVAHEAIETAQRVLRDMDVLGHEIRDQSRLRRGRVTIACTPMLAEVLLPGAITSFHRLYPDVHIHVDDCAPENFTSRVLGETVDFGVGTPDLVGEGVQTERLMTDALGLVCRQGDEIAERRTVRWKDIDRLPVMTVRPGYGFRTFLDQSAAKAGIYLNVQREVSLMSTALWMVMCGLGPAVMPATYARNSRTSGLVFKPLTFPKVSRDIYVLIKTGRSLSPAAQQFVKVLKSSVSQLATPLGSTTD